MSNELPKIAFCWRSSSLTGAQRRFISLARYLNEQGQDAIVLLEKRDVLALEDIMGGAIPYLVSYEWPWWVNLFRRRRRWPYRIWKFLGFESLVYLTTRHYLKNLQRKLGIGLWHVSMNRHLAQCIPGRAVFEVTSPDWADTLVAMPDMVPQDMLLHAVSDSVYDRLANGFPKRRIRRAPVMFPNIDPGTAVPPTIEIKERLIVFAHRFVARKNGILFAEVARRFLQYNPDWRVTFRGEGPDEETIREILNAEIASGHAEVGYIPYLTDELRRSRIFVSLIQHDNYPSQSVLEAMVSGNALLLSDRGYSREKFFFGNGIMTNLDAEAVLADLSCMAADLKELDHMGSLSFKLARERFSRKKYLEHLKNLYLEVGVYCGE